MINFSLLRRGKTYKWNSKWKENAILKLNSYTWSWQHCKRRRSRGDQKAKRKIWKFLKWASHMWLVLYRRLCSSCLLSFKVRKVNFKPQNVTFGDLHTSKSNFKWKFGPAMTAGSELLTNIWFSEVFWLKS